MSQRNSPLEPRTPFSNVGLLSVHFGDFVELELLVPSQIEGTRLNVVQRVLYRFEGLKNLRASIHADPWVEMIGELIVAPCAPQDVNPRTVPIDELASLQTFTVLTDGGEITFVAKSFAKTVLETMARGDPA